MSLESNHEAAGVFWKAIAFLFAIIGLGFGVISLRSSFRQPSRQDVGINPRTYAIILRLMGVALILLFGWGVVILVLSP